MNTIKILCLATISFAFLACSGKVQTNPLPESKQFVLPKSKITLSTELPKHRVVDFDNYLADFFNKRKNSYPRVTQKANLKLDEFNKGVIIDKNSSSAIGSGVTAKYLVVPATNSMSSSLQQKAIDKSQLNIKDLFAVPNNNKSTRQDTNCKTIDCGKALNILPKDRKDIWAIGVERGTYAR